MNLKICILILVANAAIAQSITASKMPMAFGEMSHKKTKKAFTSVISDSNELIDFDYPKCPLCKNDMRAVHTDTAMVNGVTKIIKIVQCQGGNKVLLIKSGDYRPDPITVWYLDGKVFKQKLAP